ncbi:MAG TPA: 30S ribosomal protein S20 [Armatimonadota bacterium]|jgi:small subunit ribosomal protein S20
MPQIKSRKKDLRQARARHDRNVSMKRTFRLAVRAAREQADPAAAEVAAAYKAIDKAAKANVLHPRAAARRKARLMKKINAQTS